jgi:WD40 repeat protein
MKHFFTFGLALLLLVMQPVLALADKATPEALLKGHTSTAIALAFSPDGTRLASAGDDGQFKIWDIAAGKEVAGIEGAATHKNEVRFTPDGKTAITVGAQSCVLVIDVASGKAKPSIAVEKLPGGVTALDLSPDGKTVAIVGRSALRLYDLQSGASKAEYEVHNLYAVNSVAFSPDGARVATAATDKASLVIDIATAKVVTSYDLESKGEIVLFSRDGKSLITNTSDQVIRVFDIHANQVQKLTEVGGPFHTLALSSDGKMLIASTGGLGPVTISLAGGKVYADAYGGNDYLKSAAMSPDGKWLAGGTNGGAICLWKASH